MACMPGGSPCLRLDGGSADSGQHGGGLDAGGRPWEEAVTVNAVGMSSAVRPNCALRMACTWQHPRYGHLSFVHAAGHSLRPGSFCSIKHLYLSAKTCAGCSPALHKPDLQLFLTFSK